jgi:RNA:NAD 2'-phosphotransferase (TPT1/KptA family)
MNPRQSINFSKALSKLLRHAAVEEGLEIKPDGFVKLNDVLSVSWIAKFKPSMADVRAVVEDNNKKRFELISDPESTD